MTKKNRSIELRTTRCSQYLIAQLMLLAFFLYFNLSLQGHQPPAGSQAVCICINFIYLNSGFISWRKIFAQEQPIPIRDGSTDSKGDRIPTLIALRERDMRPKVACRHTGAWGRSRALVHQKHSCFWNTRITIMSLVLWWIGHADPHLVASNQSKSVFLFFSQRPRHFFTRMG